MVGRAFGVLLVEHAVRMHAYGEGQIVLEDNVDRVSHLGPEQRAQIAEMLPFFRARFELSESRVGVFTVEGLLHHLTDLVRPHRNPKPLRVAKGLAGDLIDATRRIVPYHLIGLDVIGSRLSGRTARRASNESGHS